MLNYRVNGRSDRACVATAVRKSDALPSAWGGCEVTVGGVGSVGVVVVAPVFDDHAGFEETVVAGSAVVAAVTYELVERPLRFYKPFRTPRIVFGFGAVLTGIAVLIPVTMGAAVTTSPRGAQAQAVYEASDDGTTVVMPDTTKPNPVPSNLEPSLDRSGESTPAVYENGCHVGLLRTTPKEPCRFGDTTSQYVVVLVGDSHAAQWFPALEKVALDNGWALVSFTKSDCPSSDLTLWNNTLNRRYVECDLWRRNVIRRIDEMQPDVVVMANRSRHDEDLGGFSAD